MFGPRHDLDLLEQFNLEDELEDERTRRDILATFYFHHCLLFHKVNPEWTLQGCSFSQRGTLVLLVVKGSHEGTPYVAFVSEQTTTGCMVTFARQWLEGRVKWHKDKYRET